MARFLILLVLLPGMAWAANIKSSTDGNWSSGSTWVGGVVPAKGDNALVTSGCTVTVDLGVVRADRGDTTCRILYIDKGSMVYFDSTQSGNTLAPLQVYGGGCGGQDSTFGGNLWVFGGDTLFLHNANLCSGERRQDMYLYGASATIRFEGSSASSRACLEGIGKAFTQDTFPTWWYDNSGTAPDISLKWARFHRMGNTATTSNAGLQFSGTMPGMDVEYCIFDSVGFSCTGLQDCSFYRDTFYQYHGTFAGLTIVAGNRDTINECYFYVDHNNVAGTHTTAPLDLTVGDSLVVLSSVFRGHDLNTDVGGPWGPRGFVNFGGSTYSKALYCDVDSFVTPINWASFTNDTVAFCTLAVSGLDVVEHSGWTGSAKSNVFAGNYIYGILTPDAGDDIFNVFCTQAQTGDSLGVRFMFNTVVPKGNQIPLAFRETATLGYKRKGVHIAGNIFAGSGNDLEVNQKDTIIFRHWSSNAFNQRSLGTNAVLDSSLVPANSANISATQFGFVDSTNNDFRLAVGSPMLGALKNATDSTLCAGFFSSPNYNVGAYQGTGINVHTNNLMLGPTTLQTTNVGSTDK